MSQRSFLDLPDERRLAVLSAAATEFAAHGFDGASLNRIIARCRMSKSSFYYYFHDKAELFTVLIERGTARLASDIHFPAPEELAHGDFWNNVELIFDRIVALGMKQPWYLAVASIFYQGSGSAPPVVAAQLALARDWVERALRAGQAAGTIRTDVPFSLLSEAVFALLQALDRWSVGQMAEASPESLDGAVRVQVDFLRRMLSPAVAHP